MTLVRTLLFFILWGLFATAAQAAEVVKVRPRDGVVLKMMVLNPCGAKAVAVLFPGGSG